MQLKALALLAVTFLASVADAGRHRKPVKHIMRMRHHYPNSTAPDALQNNGLACESSPTTGTISNHGGPIMSGTVNLYFIWYGTWTTKQKNILQNLAKNIGSSPYFKVEKTYSTNGPLVFKHAVNDTGYSQGKSLNDASLPKIVSHAITTLKLPADSNGLYFINTDPTVEETGGFCTQYCGFHTHATISGKVLKYAFIGNPKSCLAGCAPCNTQVSPNGDLGVDAMASVFSHELVEAVSDPLGSTWFDAHGYENADKCAYTYGSTSRTAKGAYYNMNIGGRNYLIQQNWKRTGGCAKSA